MAIRILRLADVEARTCLSKSTIYGLIREGSFPESVPLSYRARGWLEHEIDAWIEGRVKARDAAPSATNPARRRGEPCAKKSARPHGERTGRKRSRADARRAIVSRL